MLRSSVECRRHTLDTRQSTLELGACMLHTCEYVGYYWIAVRIETCLFLENWNSKTRRALNEKSNIEMHWRWAKKISEIMMIDEEVNVAEWKETQNNFIDGDDKCRLSTCFSCALAACVKQTFLRMGFSLTLHSPKCTLCVRLSHCDSCSNSSKVHIVRTSVLMQRYRVYQ